MAKIEKTIEINGPPERVWSIVADPQSITKLTPNVTRVEATPAGLAIVGQKVHRFLKIRGRRVETFREVIEVEPQKKLRATITPGGLYEKGEEAVSLERTERGTTKVTWSFDYNLAMGVLGKALSKLLVERTLKNTANEYFNNLKKFAELRA